MDEGKRSIESLVSTLSDGISNSGHIDKFESQLITLKELSRKKEDAAALYTEKGMRVMLYYAFEADIQDKASAEAKRCLANALTLEDGCVKLFRDNRGFDSCFSSVDTLQACSFENEFLYARILFLVTAKGGHMTRDALNSHNAQKMAAMISGWLQRHQDWLTLSGNESSEGACLALSEILKLCFNLAMFLPDMSEKIFEPEGQELWTLKIIDLMLSFQEPRVQVLLPHLINLLVATGNCRMACHEYSRFKSVLTLFDQYVEAMVKKRPWNGVIINEDQIVPITSFLCDLQARQTPEIESLLKASLLVPATERHLPLGKSSSSQALLLQLLNSGSIRIREALGTLLYQVSGSNAAEFIANVGYGHAIGFLTSHGIAVSPEDIPAEYAGQDINPVTGQNLHDEQAQAAQQALKEMTDEEKEREAEKLFVLFQRLKKNGVIDVKDPIQQAVDEGRFEEM